MPEASLGVVLAVGPQAANHHTQHDYCSACREPADAKMSNELENVGAHWPTIRLGRFHSNPDERQHRAAQVPRGAGWGSLRVGPKEAGCRRLLRLLMRATHWNCDWHERSPSPCRSSARNQRKVICNYRFGPRGSSGPPHRLSQSLLVAFGSKSARECRSFSPS